MTPSLRYVVLHHAGVAEPHFDLMLEMSPGALLSTWRLPHWPPQRGDIFTPLDAHRRDYLEYEGPISQNRGEVKRIASGTIRSIAIQGSLVIVNFADGTDISLPKI